MELSDHCGPTVHVRYGVVNIKCKSTYVYVTASEWDSDVCSLHNTCDRKLVSYLVSLPFSSLAPSLNRWRNSKGEIETT